MRPCLKAQKQCLRDVSVFKSGCYSFQEPELDSQHIHGGSQYSVAPVPGHSTFSPDLWWHQACTWCTQRHVVCFTKFHQNWVKLAFTPWIPGYLWIWIWRQWVSFALGLSTGDRAPHWSVIKSLCIFTYWTSNTESVLGWNTPGVLHWIVYITWMAPAGEDDQRDGSRSQLEQCLHDMHKALGTLVLNLINQSCWHTLIFLALEAGGRSIRWSKSS